MILGVYGLPHCPGSSSICNVVRELLNYGAYVEYESIKPSTDRQAVLRKHF